jgi:transposase
MPHLTRAEVDQRKLNDEPGLLAEVCRLHRFPCLSSPELAVHFGVSQRTLENWLAKGRKAGLKTKGDVIKGHPTEPSLAEMQWRLLHQAPREFVQRFSADASVLDPERIVEQLGLRNELPIEWVQAVYGAAAPLRAEPPAAQLDPSGRRAILLGGTDIAVEFKTDAERQLIEHVVLDLVTERRVEGGAWGAHVLPIIQQRISIERRRVLLDDSKDEASRTALKDYQAALHAWWVDYKGLPLEPRTGATAYELARQGIDSAIPYLADHGFEETVACPVCGAFVHTYLLVYRDLVAVWLLARSIKDEQGAWRNSLTLACQQQDFLAWADMVLDRFTESPLLTRQLRELGFAWNQPLVASFEELMRRRPGVTESDLRDALAGAGLDPETEARVIDSLRPLLPRCAPLTWDDCGFVLSAFLELGDLCVKANFPFSGLAAVRTDAEGHVAMVFPED